MRAAADAWTRELQFCEQEAVAAVRTAAAALRAAVQAVEVADYSLMNVVHPLGDALRAVEDVSAALEGRV